MKNFVPIAIGMNMPKILYLLGVEILCAKLFFKTNINSKLL